MKTIRDVINELTEMLATFGDLPVFITEANEPGKPLTPINGIVALEVGIADEVVYEGTNNEHYHWTNDEYDTACIFSTSEPKDIINRIYNNL